MVIAIAAKILRAFVAPRTRDDGRPRSENKTARSKSFQERRSLSRTTSHYRKPTKIHRIEDLRGQRIIRSFTYQLSIVLRPSSLRDLYNHNSRPCYDQVLLLPVPMETICKLRLDQVIYEDGQGISVMGRRVLKRDPWEDFSVVLRRAPF